jgi:hyperosmotically inducible protein
MKITARLITAVVLSTCTLSGCWVAAGAVGAEGAYVASQETRSTGETLDDQIILTSIKTKMLADSQVSGLAINVDVYRGNVELRGYIHSQSEIDKAVFIAKSTNGVRQVTSKLVLDYDYKTDK